MRRLIYLHIVFKNHGLQKSQENARQLINWQLIKEQFLIFVPEMLHSSSYNAVIKIFFAQGKYMYLQMDEKWWNNWIWWGLEQDWWYTKQTFHIKKLETLNTLVMGGRFSSLCSYITWHQMKKSLLIAYGMKVHSCDCKTTDKTTATDQLVQHLIWGLVTQESLMNAWTT